MAEIVCIGEALIDLVPTMTGGPAAAETFVKAAGGAPASVAAGVARLGVASAFVGAVGEDAFGRFIGETLAAAGVDLAGLRFERSAPTALAIVSLRPDGERDFLFYGTPAAHTMLAPEDVDETSIRDAKLLHFGSISLIGGPARAATLHAVEIARRHGVLVSFDPNLRLSLWPDAEAARDAARLGLSLSDLVKIAAEEVEFLAGGCDLVESARALWHPDLKLMAVTRGARGCVWLDRSTQGEERGFPVEAVDTTGAGDAFMAGLLAEFIRQPDMIGDPLALGRATRFACAAGALATLRRGSIAALPDRADVERFLFRHVQAAATTHRPARRRSAVRRTGPSAAPARSGP